jgi:hypothetical protein
MKSFAESYMLIDDLLSNSDKHVLSKQQIDALEIAKKAISAIELMGLAVKEAETNSNS